eukprot:555410-Amphidinium_carterae.1
MQWLRRYKAPGKHLETLQSVLDNIDTRDVGNMSFPLMQQHLNVVKIGLALQAENGIHSQHCKVFLYVIVPCNRRQATLFATLGILSIWV